MIKFIKCKDDNQWNDFVEKEKENQFITIAHNPSLSSILSKTFGYTNQNLLILNESKIIGALPAVSIRNKIVSLPHFSYGGPVFDSTVEVDLNPFLKDKKFELRSFSKLSQFFNDEKITCFLELQKSEEDQWLKFKSKLRNQIKKSLKYNLLLKQGKLELLNDFYLIYSQNMLRLGSPPIGKSFFKNLINDYKYGEAEITVVYYEGKPVASGFTLSYFNFNEVCWASADYKFNKYNVNMFLYWGLIKSSILKNHKYFSFGRTTANSATHKFKKQWGSIDVPLYFNYSEERTTSIKNFEILTKIWKLQPLVTANYFGGLISKYVY